MHAPDFATKTDELYNFMISAKIFCKSGTPERMKISAFRRAIQAVFSEFRAKMTIWDIFEVFGLKTTEKWSKIVLF